MKVSKKEVTSALLCKGKVFVHLDPRKLGVVLPPNLRLQPQVVLQIGWDMPVPIPDLSLDEEGIYGTLSFKGVPFTCFLPWRTIFAVVGEDARGLTWEEDMPAEVSEERVRDALKNVVDIKSQSKPATRQGTTQPTKGKVTGKPRHLKLVKS